MSLFNIQPSVSNFKEQLKHKDLKRTRNVAVFEKRVRKVLGRFNGQTKLKQATTNQNKQKYSKSTKKAVKGLIVQGNVATIRGELLTLATTPNRRPTSTSWHGYNAIMLNTNALEYLLLITEMCIKRLNSYLLHYKRTVI